MAPWPGYWPTLESPQVEAGTSDKSCDWYTPTPQKVLMVRQEPETSPVIGTCTLESPQA